MNVLPAWADQHRHLDWHRSLIVMLKRRAGRSGDSPEASPRSATSRINDALSSGMAGRQNNPFIRRNKDGIRTGEQPVATVNIA